MKRKSTWTIAVIGAALGIMAPASAMCADSGSFKRLSAEWWQWALSIPTPVNPLLDDSGADCMVGQRGPVWFLAGNFGGGTTVRACSIPEGVSLFFPALNAVNFNTPGVCGQGSVNIPFDTLLEQSAEFVDAATNVSVELDGQPVRYRRAQSKPFEIALPEDNVFDEQCLAAGLGNVPANIYSPAAADGFYVKLQPLDVGIHTLHFHADDPGLSAPLDVTYHLTVVAVSLE